jgi:hypothetical protein
MVRSLQYFLLVACSGCAALHAVANRGTPPGRGPSGAEPNASSAGAARGQPGVAGGAQLPPLPDDGLTSETHKSFLGQIVFSTAQIAKDHPDESTLGAEFYADELIYGRAYLRQSIENVPVFEDGSDKPLRTETRGYRYKLYVDGVGVEHELESRTVSADRRKATTLQVWPRPSPSDEPTPRGWVELVNGLAPGDHVVRIELWAQDKWRRGREVLAAGELTLHKAAGVAIGSGKTFADIKRGMKDPALERDLVAGARAFAKKQGWKETFTDVAIVSPAWIDVRHKVGYLIGRQLQTQALATWPEGNKCTAQALLFQQKIERDRPVGPIYVGTSGEQTLLDCSASSAQSVDHWKGRTRAKPTPTRAGAVAVTPPVASPRSVPPTPPTQVTTTPTSPTSPTPPPPASTTRPSGASTSRVASVTPETPVAGEVTAHAPRTTSSAPSGRFEIAIGVAANAIDATGVASYASLGVHLGRVQLGIGATWPFNALGYARFAVIAGRFELSPMVSAGVLAEPDRMTEVAVSGGLSVAYALKTGPLSAGLRIDALVSYNLEPAAIAIPVLGSTYLRF